MLGIKTILKIAAVISLSASFVGCERNLGTYKDIEILQAREFLADYEKRLSIARETALLCITSGGKPFDCNEIAYRQQLFELDWNGETYQLSSYIRDTVHQHKRIAYIKTSYELDKLQESNK